MGFVLEACSFIELPNVLHMSIQDHSIPHAIFRLMHSLPTSKFHANALFQAVDDIVKFSPAPKEEP